MAAMAVIPSRALPSRFRSCVTRRGSSSLSSRLPGELTGSGNDMPYDPSTAVAASEPIHPRWEVVPRLLAPPARTGGVWIRRGLRMDPCGPLPRTPADTVDRPRDRPPINRPQRSKRVAGVRWVTPSGGLDHRARDRLDQAQRRDQSALRQHGERRALVVVEGELGGGPSSTVTTQSWQARPRTTQVSQSMRVVMQRTLTGGTDNGRPRRVALGVVARPYGRR